jgi:hypothetical protein
LDLATAYRAIIRLVANDYEGYKSILSEENNLIDVKYYISKNKSIQAKLDTNTGELYLHDGTVKQWAKPCAIKKGVISDVTA